MAEDAPMSDVFYEELARIVEANLEKENFGVSELVQEAGLSRSQVHRRLKSITGQSISQFIREIRLIRAHELLQDQSGTASEIAYKVGFNSPTYFNKCFQDQFGYPPGSAKKQELKPIKGWKPSREFVLIGVALLVVGVLSVATLNYFNPLDSSNSKKVPEPAEPYLTHTMLDKTIAVLPFKDDSDSSENQYFCDGMMDEIRIHLQKVAELKVESRTAVEPYRNDTKGIAAIAEELEVAYILEGAVRKYGDRFRLTIQLIEVESGNHLLWSETYDGIFSDTIFTIQSNIARKVAVSLNAVITPEEGDRIDKFPTTNIAAYDLCIRAKHERFSYWTTLDPKHLEASHDLYDKALQIDPEYLHATEGKAATFVAGSENDSALHYAQRVIALDPENDFAYLLKGDIYFYKGEGDLAIENYSKAIDINPSIPWYHVALGRVYSSIKNDVIQALLHFNKGYELDPQPTSFNTIGAAYLHIGNYERAEEYLRKAFDYHKNCFGWHNMSRLMLAKNQLQETQQLIESFCKPGVCVWNCAEVLFETSLILDDLDQAEQYFYQWQNLPGFKASFELARDYQIGYVYYQQGRTAEGDKIFNEQIQKLKSSSDKGFEADKDLHLSRIHAFRGNRSEALLHLKKYAESGFYYGWHDYILIDPFYKSLREDTGFKAIVKKVQDDKAALRRQEREMRARGELDF